jgi:hypothetical protein
VRSDDQVFQLSLTEMAFVIVFLVLLLLGWMVFDANRERSRALGATNLVANARSAIAADRPGNDPDDLVRQSGTADRTDVVSRVVESVKLTAVNAALRARIEELDRTLSALTEVRNAIAAEKAKDATAATDAVRREVLTGLAMTAAVRQSLIKPHARQERGGDAAQHVVSRETLLAEATSAIALKAAIERRLKTELGRVLPSTAEGAIAELVAAAGSVASHHRTAENFKSAEKDNKDLRGQVAFLTARLGVKGGRDYPPCWAEESTGKLQYLFAIDIRNEGLVIRAAWPEARDTDAKLLAGINGLLLHSPLKLSAFNEAMQGIERSSKTKNCRHYVLLRNYVKDLHVFNRYRYAIENYFYKLELRT